MSLCVLTVRVFSLCVCSLCVSSLCVCSLCVSSLCVSCFSTLPSSSIHDRHRDPVPSPLCAVTAARESAAAFETARRDGSATHRARETWWHRCGEDADTVYRRRWGLLWQWPLLCWLCWLEGLCVHRRLRQSTQRQRVATMWRPQQTSQQRTAILLGLFLMKIATYCG